jgi:aerobic carbon-monoxide dehydrogenase medium subunit
MIPASFDYIAPRTIAEAIRALGAHGEDAKVLAGGHSLLPLLKLRLAEPKVLIDIAKVPGLNEIKQQGDTIVVGALATHYQIESSALLRKSCPLLCQTARAIGDVQVRNRGTIGGSLAHADPAADWPAAILALGAKLKISGPNGERALDSENFFVGPLTTALEPHDILTAIEVSAARRRAGMAYQKASQQASGFAIVGVAVSLQLNSSGSLEEIGVGVTGFADKPFRARAVEAKLRGKKPTAKAIAAAAAVVADGVDALEDLSAAADYRAHLARVYTARAIQAALKPAR